MGLDIHAEELARRLTASEVARFKAVGETVELDDDLGFQVPLVVLDAGTGRPEQVRRALDAAHDARDVPVIVGRHFGAPSLALLAEADANYMDDRHLRVRLAAPSILVRLERGAEPVPVARETSLSLSGAAGAVAIGLLGDPTADWKVTDLADSFNVALGTAQAVLVALEAEGLVERVGKGPATRRRVTDAGALLDRYALDAVADRRVLARGFLLEGEPVDVMREASERLRATAPGVRFGFTGTAAAQMLAPYLTSVRTFEMWVTTPHRADFVLEAIGAMPVEDGANLLLLRGPQAVLAGGTRTGGVGLPSTFRVYADALLDPARGEEQAEHLRQTLIRF